MLRNSILGRKLTSCVLLWALSEYVYYILQSISNGEVFMFGRGNVWLPILPTPGIYYPSRLSSAASAYGRNVCAQVADCIINVDDNQGRS